RVVVIGGGPAGLEAALVAALRGHRVELHERDATLGGQARWVGHVPAMRELAKIIAWQEAQLAKLQVVVRRNSPVTPAAVAALDADAVIVATGARTRRPTVPGAGAIPVLSPEDVVQGAPAKAGIAVVSDESGLYGAIGAAEVLLGRGVAVHLVTPSFMAAEDMDVVRRVPVYQRLAQAGCHMHPNRRLARIEGGAAVLASVYDGPEERIAGVDAIVVWHGRDAEDGLRAALDARGGEVHWIGDSVAPRQLDIAMAEGAMAGRAV
ncbi:MAG: FAD-dependent oxidoreductase, partial [Alphaproteobacteria bacterium]